MFKVKEIMQTCRACPSQWEGYTEDNRQIYVRYRWGYLSVRVGPENDHEEFAAVRGNEIFGQQLGGEYAGILCYDELQDVTRDRIAWPKDMKVYETS